MKIYVIDKDPMIAQFINSKMEPLGHKIIGETSKKAAAEYCQNNDVDMVFLDPSPLTSPRALVSDIRRQTPYYPYTVLMSNEDITQQDALKLGVNDVIAKPFDPAKLDEKIDNANRFLKLVKRMADDSEDFPSAGGIIAKSAYNQLFLSAVDRADRYGENTYLMFISLSSYKDIFANEGPYAADYTVAKLSQYLVTLRRQSDIIGQTSPFEYSLILSRPIYETEPREAAARFIESLSTYDGFKNLDTKNIYLNVKLMAIPSGEQIIDETFKAAVD
ncbi:MAG: response regulator [Micavibrio sp.]|nr:response regulator [Micavibrio sp.]